MKLPRAWPVIGGLLLVLLAAPGASVAQDSAFTKPVAPDFSGMKKFYTEEQARQESQAQAAEVQTSETTAPETETRQSTQVDAAHAQLSPTAQAFLLDKKIISAMESGDHAAAGLFAQRREVEAPVPPAMQIETARVHYALGDYVATHGLLTEYLNAAAPDSPNYDTAPDMYIELEANPEYLAQKEKAEAEQERLRPGRVFSDCDVCPEMVVVPAGSFMMGSPSSEEGRYDDEGPVHQVNIARPFAAGVREVTFAEWDACVADGECNGYSPGDEGWGRGKRPVINVSWEDARGYVQWLSARTGEDYRLLSESEWEYAARAGTTTAYHFGDSISPSQANYDRSEGGTVPVGSYPANAFGLHDVHGNVWEWTQDCRNDNYQGAPTDGSAWESGNCSRRVLRGGSWYYDPWVLRSANRDRSTAGDRNYIVGFRVARTLTP